MLRLRESCLRHPDYSQDAQLETSLPLLPLVRCLRRQPIICHLHNLFFPIFFIFLFFIHRSLSLFGVVLCLTLMMMMSWYIALVAIVVAASIYKYIEYKGSVIILFLLLILFFLLIFFILLSFFLLILFFLFILLILPIFFIFLIPPSFSSFSVFHTSHFFHHFHIFHIYFFIVTFQYFNCYNNR